jgi:hypothetical protein
MLTSGHSNNTVITDNRWMFHDHPNSIPRYKNIRDLTDGQTQLTLHEADLRLIFWERNQLMIYFVGIQPTNSLTIIKNL